jgi:hypothetical protein
MMGGAEWRCKRDEVLDSIENTNKVSLVPSGLIAGS